MSIQQSFNQGLMGTTFLLGQMPQFKQAQEAAADYSRFKKEGKVIEKTRNLIDKRAEDEAKAVKTVLAEDEAEAAKVERARNEAEAAKAVLAKQSHEFLAGFSKSSDPRLRAKAAIATSRLMKGNYDKRISDALQNQSAQSKREQADAKIMDRFETIERNRKRELDSIRNLRGQLSNRQTKRLTYKINQKYDKEIDEERRAQNGADE